jgi:hypothetical protein
VAAAEATVTTPELLSFMREHSSAVQASVSAAGRPQAAVVGIVVTDDFEVYIRTRPVWIRYSDFNRDPPEIVEFDFVQPGRAD